jgi:hypothetical protein
MNSIIIWAVAKILDLENVTNATFVHHQASLLLAATNSLNLLRRLWQTHPANADWDEPNFATEGSKSYWL